MILPERVNGLLHRLRDALDGTAPEYDATELIDALDAVLTEAPPVPRPQRRIQLIVELTADTTVDYDQLSSQLGDWLEDVANAQNDSYLRVGGDAGNLALCLHLDPDAATGAQFVADLEAWRRRDDADRH